MRRVEADCDAGAAAVMSEARALPYVEDVTIFGNALHLLVARRAWTTGGSRATSRRPPARGHASARSTPSLEDVFVRLTRLQVEQRGEIRRSGGGADEGFLPVLRKEALQMVRDRGTLRFALLSRSSSSCSSA